MVLEAIYIDTQSVSCVIIENDKFSAIPCVGVYDMHDVTMFPPGVPQETSDM